MEKEIKIRKCAEEIYRRFGNKGKSYFTIGNATSSTEEQEKEIKEIITVIKLYME